MQVSFKNHKNDATKTDVRYVGHKNDSGIGTGPETEVCEIVYPSGVVGVFPANEQDVSTSQQLGRPVTFEQAYPVEYRAFKSGGNDSTRVAQLESEIKERQDELKALRDKPKKDVGKTDRPLVTKTPDDPRLVNYDPPVNRPGMGSEVRSERAVTSEYRGDEPQGVATPDNPAGNKPRETLS